MTPRGNWGEPVPVPERYSQIEGLRKHGKLPAASGPCIVCHQEPPHYESGAARFTYDHCHIHDWVRGELCRNCNSSLMTAIDARIADVRPWIPDDLLAALLTNWHRCPQCAAEGWAARWRHDRAADDAWIKAWRAAQRANPGITNAELHQVAAHAAHTVSPAAVRGVLGGYWCIPIPERDLTS